MPLPMLKLKGRRFGWLKVLDYFGQDKRGNTLWACVCKCGGAKVNLGIALTRKWVPLRSCGCRKGKIGHFKNGKPVLGAKLRRTYASYRAMLTRCLNPNSDAFGHYGGRGIKICERWLGKQGFANFVQDMGIRPANRTLDRIKVNGNYRKSNCRWADHMTQVNNRRCSPANKPNIWMSDEEAETF